MQKVKPDDRKYLLLIEKIEQIFTYGFVLSKELYFQNLQKASGFEELLNKNNMETLISRGVRIPHISKEDAMHNIVIIDTIILAVYGKQYNLKS